MTKTSILQTIENLENSTRTDALVLDLVKDLGKVDRDYFNVMLQKRDDMLIAVETHLMPQDLEKGLLYYIALHGLLHQELSQETDSFSELSITLKTFDLLNYVDANVVKSRGIDEKLFSAYGGMLLVSDSLEAPRAKIEQALHREFRTGGVLEPGLFGHKINNQKFREVLEILKATPQKTLRGLITK